MIEIMREKTSQTDKNQTRVGYIDGVRGIAAMMVMMHHFACAFYPAIIFGTLAQPHVPFERTIAATPLNLFFNGNFAVCMFFVISGFVLSRKFFLTHHLENVIILTIRRYIRLMVPVLGSFFLGYLLLTLHLYYNRQIADTTYSWMWLKYLYNFPPSIVSVFWQGMINIFLHTSGGKYNSVTWTIPYEFRGSLLVFLLLAIFGKYSKRFIVYAIAGLLFWNTYYLGFVLGMIAADETLQVSGFLHRTRVFGILPLLCLLAFYLGSYPQMLPVNSTMYAALPLPWITNEDSGIFYHTIGAFLLFIIIPQLPAVSSFLSTKPLLFLGKISFSIFLVHLLIITSLSSWLFSVFLPSLGYHAAVTASFILSLPVIFTAAYLFHRLIMEYALPAIFSLQISAINYVKLIYTRYMSSC